jgi:transcriptional regulator with XRE-family HTH domain
MPRLRTCISPPFLTMSKPPSETRPPAPQPDRAKAMLEFLARRIRSVRQRLGISQEEFASRCGISVSFASLLERAERSPSYETLLQIADALEMSLAELFRSAAGQSHDDPYYLKLVEFARRRKLSRMQVDRLIALGQVVFDGRVEAPAARPPLGRAHKSMECSVAACGRSVLAKGLCSSHYHRARRAKP